MVRPTEDDHDREADSDTVGDKLFVVFLTLAFVASFASMCLAIWFGW